MTAPIYTPLTGDVLDLTIDDFLEPLPETVRLGGPGPFVINLSTSSSPIDLPAQNIAGCQHAHVYQVQRTEDRRQRYRLRLGPFADEDEVDAVLKLARDSYPSALTATADAEDLRAIAFLQAKAEALQPPVQRPPSKPVEFTLELAVTPPNPPVPSVEPEGTPLQLRVEVGAAPAPIAKPVSIPSPPVQQVVSAPAPIAKPADVPSRSRQEIVTALALTTKPAGIPPQLRPEIVTAPAPIARPAAIPVQPTQNAAAAPAPRPVEQPSKPLPALDATQTIRALTQLELEDDQASQWFVIQLSLAEDAFDPETLPNLDIFSEYRLYSVAGIDQGRIVHALRLGFFTEDVAARAVASYLSAHYEKPTIKRVSSAERERFANQRLEPRKDVGATGRHAAIEITDERFVREKRTTYVPRR